MGIHPHLLIMFTQDIEDENKVIVNPVQESPSRSSIYAINRCEDQVIGFEFISKKYIDNPICCSSISHHLCIPIDVVTPIPLDTVEFWATDDPCYKDWIIKKNTEPDVEVQRDGDNNVTGIIVRFSQYESCCYPLQLAFRLYALDSEGCKYSLSSGLLLIR